VPRLRVGYWAAAEQHNPELLIQYAKEAEVVGFDMIAVSDHFSPWRDKDGQAGFPWVWLAAAASQTKSTEVGTAVTTPTHRYHPAIVAQAFATLDYLFPGRIFVTLGTGHKMNETPLGFDWPKASERIERLVEAVEIIELLWKGDFVNYQGKYYKLSNAKLYTRPKKKIPVFIATANAKVAALAGRLGDGILTNPRGLENHIAILKAMQDAAVAAGKDPSKLGTCLEFKVSYDTDYDRAFKSASYWAPTALPKDVREEISDPRELEAKVGPAELEGIKKTWLITDESDDIIRRLGEFLKMGFNRVYIHSASPNEHRFLHLIGRDILPWMKEYYESLTDVERMTLPLRTALD
jgi:coenzyme F420-dependent glucose-6-phosphate dehydrogenase